MVVTLLRWHQQMAARFILFVAFVLSSLPIGASAQTTHNSKPADEPRDTNIRAHVELLRTDVRAQKVAILTELMDLSDTEDAVFWPIYREYAVELAKINDDRI